MKPFLIAFFFSFSLHIVADEINPQQPNLILPIDTLEEGCERQPEEEDLVAERSGHSDNNERPNMFDMMQERRHEERRKRLLKEHSQHQYYQNRL